MINSKAIPLAPNHVIIKVGNELHFYSYDSYICTYNINSNYLTLKNNMWNYSYTTRKYFKQFVNEYTKLSYKSKDEFIKMMDMPNIVNVA